MLSGGRAELKWTPNDRLSATLTALDQNAVYDGQTAIDETLGKQPIYGDLKQARAFQEKNTSTTEIENLAVNYDLGWATLTSSTSYLRVHTHVLTDLTQDLGEVFQHALHLPVTPTYEEGALNTNRATVEEVRLASDQTEPLKWIVGLYYDHNEIKIARPDRFLSPAALTSLPPLRIGADDHQDTYAAFGEATYAVTKAISLTGGFRYTDVTSKEPEYVYGLAFAAAGAPTKAKELQYSPTGDSGNFSPKIEAEYKFDSDRLVYVEAAEGFRPGGPNLNVPGVSATYAADTLWNYEVGAKTGWFNRRLIVNAALYYIDWRDIQALAYTATKLPYIANAGAAVSKGVELEIHARPARNWTLGLSGAYDDARYTQNSAALGVMSNDRVPLVPIFSGSATAEYRRPITGGVDGFAFAELKNVGGTVAGYQTGFGNPNGVTLSGYTSVDLRVGAAIHHNWEASLFVNNVGDVRGQSYIDTSNYPQNLHVFIIQPRTVGIKISASL
jgi:outer membrane receptor protein involved in Fe transport